LFGGDTDRLFYSADSVSLLSASGSILVGRKSRRSGEVGSHTGTHTGIRLQTLTVTQ
jgi:hypothetical protein